jgi:hypothetical protein
MYDFPLLLLFVSGAGSSFNSWQSLIRCYRVQRFMDNYQKYHTIISYPELIHFAPLQAGTLRCVAQSKQSEYSRVSLP